MSKSNDTSKLGHAKLENGVLADSELYLVPKCMTLGRFPNGGESDSTRRTEEVRHVGSDTFAPGF